MLILNSLIQTYTHDLVDLMNFHQVHSRVKAFIDNLISLANSILDCAVRKSKGDPVFKMGLTSLAIYVSLSVQQKNNFHVLLLFIY